MLPDSVYTDEEFEAFVIQVSHCWARLAGERKIAFATKTGSGYVLQAHDGEHYVLRQIVGESMWQNMGLDMHANKVLCAKSDVHTRTSKFLIQNHDGKQTVWRTSPVQRAVWAS